MVQDQVGCEVVVRAPLEQVWAVLTRAEEIAKWYAFDGAEVDPRPDGAMLFRWKEHGTFHGRVVRIEPPRLFSFRYASLSPDEQPRAGNSTLVEFTLAPEGDSTRLRVVESGFTALEGSDAAREEHAENSRQAWAAGLDELQKLAELSAQGPGHTNGDSSSC